ncbi:Rap1a/Tai family immunity protein [Kiloniella laminariae]|uniref:Rap1a/Tai family immunity protein n=1 Tax=Kiloniella laminariae TaxID=454162 RepID=A0ABT4LI43_9PROT|nr:Rap1a/Tai family immunity protein [Kiloniella laminariae]MCZ4280779.1 Rap1a/Tai family immunity protein [Kiloniella laminariae]
MLKALSLLLILFLTSAAQAESQLTEKELVTLCSSQDRWYGGLCNGYITGTVESLLEMREQGLIAEAFCFPAQTTRGNYIDQIRSVLAQSSSPNTPAIETIVLILKDRYPCE